MKLTKLFEQSSTGNLALSKMIAFVSRKLDTKFIRIPGVEHFKNSHESGYGVRFVESGSTLCIRFNWKSEASVGSVNGLMSIDIFTGKSHDPNFTIHATGISIAQALPAVLDAIQSPKVGKHKVFPVAPKDALTEAFIFEARREDYTTETALEDFISQMRSGKTFTRSEFIGRYHIVHAGIFDTIMDNFKNEFEVSGKRIGLSDSAKTAELKDMVLSKAGIVEVTKGGSKEVYMKSAQEEALEAKSDERIPYLDTLEHLEGLVAALIKGSFNALFVAGKGGTGKTQTVERVLHEKGLRDGDGYFKNTGSASAAGVYTLLYHHRNDIILFDDSDGALADVDARNLIKAATDTKKSRKMVWNKRSSFIFDPEMEDPEQYDDDITMAPKYFDFKGRIIFISNLPLNKLDPDGALRTRAFVINVDPTNEEMFEHMERILFDIRLEGGLTLSKDERLEVLEVVKSSKRKGDVSLRKLVRALNLAASGASNWKTLVDLYA